MKTHLVPHLVTVAFGLAALSATAAAENQKVAQAAVAPSIAVTSISVTSPAPPPASVVAVAPAPSTPTAAESRPPDAVPVAAAAQPDAASARWAEVENCTYDQRVQFSTGFKRLDAKVDDQIMELTAKRAAMNSSTADTKDWDFAMKEMQDARAYLKSMGAELRLASRETWDQKKDKVAQAWVRTQDAYAKVKSSTTG